MEGKHSTQNKKSFSGLRKQIDADPERRARVEEHKSAMLGDLRRELDLTQAAIADRLNVTQENVSQIERGESDLRISTLQRYVEALGGHLEVRAEFPGHSTNLSVGKRGKTAKQVRVTKVGTVNSRKAKTKRAAAS
ncbi:MAG: helix-turn-helix domain-containing protein [Actinomycetes bacterium]